MRCSARNVFPPQILSVDSMHGPAVTDATGTGDTVLLRDVVHVCCSRMALHSWRGAMAGGINASMPVASARVGRGRTGGG